MVLIDRVWFVCLFNSNTLDGEKRVGCFFPFNKTVTAERIYRLRDKKVMEKKRGSDEETKDQ